MPSSAHQLANGDHSPTASSSQPRIKQSRPHSPTPSSADASQPADVKPPAPKRARKAINCEPCRNSKLKCDRNRPCSSCVLRGTTATCYQQQDGDAPGRAEESFTRIDPAVEFTRIRQSLTLLESHMLQQGGRSASVGQPGPPPSSAGPSKVSVAQTPPSAPHRNGSMKEPRASSSPDLSEAKASCAPGLLGQSDPSGYFAGPTSTLSHILSVKDDASDPSSADNLGASLRSANDNLPYEGYDQDLTNSLPPMHTLDGLIDYYFEYCNWIYRHVNQNAFLRNWMKFKMGHSGNRVTLATVCIIILLAVRYLPNGHPLLSTLGDTFEGLEGRYYGIMREALQRHQRDMRRDGMGKGYTVDLVELLLVRSHYLTFAKEDPEETWSVKGELVNIGTAMGLHKDPGDTRFPLEEAERRRWAWWHIILLERWQAFMFGRPLSIASNHFNTRLPSYCDPSSDKSGRLYLPNIALFKLAFVLGDIMDDAVSFRAVPYSSIQESDKKLVKWYDELPEELDQDEYRIARSLASSDTYTRRVGVLSVIIRTAYYHIRFTLHRPYATNTASLGIAVSAAGKLIALVGQTRPDFLSNTALAVPGHMNWGPFHVFSAAMFFSFQLIGHPDQPAAALFRDNIRKAIGCLEQSRWMPVADKALTILQALAPLYSDDFAQESPEEKKRSKAQILKVVRTLAFPYQDAQNTKGDSSTGSSPALTVPRSSFGEAPSPPLAYGPGHKHPQTQLPVSSMRWTPTDADHVGPQRSMAEAASTLHSMSPVSAPSPSQTLLHHQAQPMPYSQVQYSNMSVPMQQHDLGLMDSNAFFIPAQADEGYWGASVGFASGEWSQFVSDVRGTEGMRMNGLTK